MGGEKEPLLKTLLPSVYKEYDRKAKNMRPAAYLPLQVRPVHVVSALYLTQILCPLLLQPQTERISSFSRQTKETYRGSTLIEDNAENEEITPFWGVQLLVN